MPPSRRPTPLPSPAEPAAHGTAAGEGVVAWHREPGLAWQLVIAVATSGGAFLVRLGLDPWLLNRQPFTPAFAAIAIAGWYGTWRAGVLCAVLSHLWANYFFVEPRGQLTLTETELVGAGSYYLITAVLLVLSHRATGAIAMRDKTLQRLRRVDARRAEFIAALSHELRNPLGALRLALHEMRALPDPAQAVEKVTPMMERQLLQVARLCDDLMDIARIDQGKMSLERREVSVAELAQSAVEETQAHLQRRGQRVALQLDGAPRVRVDPHRMVQLIANLLHNASKFSPDGAEITLRAALSGEQLCLHVSDPGVGLSPERLDSVFDAFAQGDGATEGLGLGLALVRRIAELHGGTVRAHSAGAGHGAEFEVCLPRG